MGALARGAMFALVFGASAGVTAVEPGSPAPGFSLPSIDANAPAHDSSGRSSAAASDGSPIRLADYRGRVVYVDFWSAWCAPCREALPRLSAFRESQPRAKFEILSVNVDALVEDGRRVLASTPVAYPVASDVLQLTTESFGVDVLPAGALIDADGIVRGFWQGELAVDHVRLKRELNLLISGGAGVE